MAKRASSRIALRGLCLVFMAAGACNQVFDIQEAHVDPTLHTTGGSAQGGASNQAGVGTASGGASSAGTSGSASAGYAGKAAQGGGANVAGAGAAGEGGGAAQGGDVGSGGALTGQGGNVTSTEGGAGGGSGGGPVTPDLCVDYCNQVTQYCTGDNLQYKDLEQCLKVCEYFPQGMVGEPDGDSVACRLKYAGKARYAGGTELAAYCRQGGPGGDGRCGSNCDGFCDISQATCSAAETAPYYYPSRQACENSCATLPDIPFVYGSKESADGNSVQCRLFHVMSAAMADAGEHCAHVLGITLCETTSE